MKKLILIVFTAIVALNARNVMAKTSESNKEKSAVTIQNSSDSKLTKEEAQQLVNRVHEIQKMDKRNLTLKQRRDLKKELIMIKEKVEKDPVVIAFSSTGLLLIIILLLIFL